MRTITLIISIFLLTGGVIYLSNRIKSVFPTLRFALIITILSLITILSVIGSTVLFLTPSPFGSFLYRASFFILVSIGGVILASWLVALLNMALGMKQYARACLSVVVAAAFITYGMIHALTVKVVEVTIPLKGLTTEVTAVLLTDMHLGNFYSERQLESVVDKIIELNPDVVFNTGDLFEGRSHFNDKSDVLAPFRKLTMPHYFVIGNHDEHVGADLVYKELEKTDVIVLRNQITDFKGIQIIGLNNMPADSTSSTRHTLPGVGTVDNTLQNMEIDKEKPTIVLHHHPQGAEYMEAENADLLLAGHTHAGQMFPISLIAKKTHTYNHGLYTLGNMKIYVSAGTGAVSFPFRLGTDSELTYLKLIPEDQNTKKVTP